MASEIKVTNIKANDGTASLTIANSTGAITEVKTGTIKAADGTAGVTIANSTGAITASGGIANAGTITAGTFNGTVGSTATFPAGHIVSHATPYYDPSVASDISTNQQSFQESGIEVSLTTKYSSSNSRIIIQFHSGFMRMSGSSAILSVDSRQGNLKFISYWFSN